MYLHQRQIIFPTQPTHCCPVSLTSLIHTANSSQTVSKPKSIGHPIPQPPRPYLHVQSPHCPPPIRRTFQLVLAATPTHTPTPIKPPHPISDTSHIAQTPLPHRASISNAVNYSSRSDGHLFSSRARARARARARPGGTRRFEIPQDRHDDSI